jgi:hypothetical protein
VVAWHYAVRVYGGIRAIWRGRIRPAANLPIDIEKIISSITIKTIKSLTQSETKVPYYNILKLKQYYYGEKNITKWQRMLSAMEKFNQESSNKNSTIKAAKIIGFFLNEEIWKLLIESPENNIYENKAEVKDFLMKLCGENFEWEDTHPKDYETRLETLKFKDDPYLSIEFIQFISENIKHDKQLCIISFQMFLSYIAFYQQSQSAEKLPSEKLIPDNIVEIVRETITYYPIKEINFFNKNIYILALYKQIQDFTLIEKLSLEELKTVVESTIIKNQTEYSDKKTS